jgi:TPP-dependent pyruvate/acetoin dehydrogenase alpha subunit
MKPRKKFRQRPKKSGAKKRQRVRSQKKRLVEAGYTEEDLKHKSISAIRDMIKDSEKRKRKPSVTVSRKKKAEKTA